MSRPTALLKSTATSRFSCVYNLFRLIKFGASTGPTSPDSQLALCAYFVNWSSLNSEP